MKARLSKSLAALDRHLADQNRTAVEPVQRSSKTWAPIAPMPDDPMQCRWCGKRRIVLPDTAQTKFCQNGCSANDTAYLCHCERCGRNFESGARLAGICLLCAREDRREAAAMQATTPRYELNPEGYTTLDSAKKETP